MVNNYRNKDDSLPLHHRRSTSTSSTGSSTPDPHLHRTTITLPLPTISPSPRSDPNSHGNPNNTTNRRPAQQVLQHRHSLPRMFSADLDQHILRGLTIAGVAVCCLSTLFSIFHVDVFLRVYQLPYTTYSVGRLLFSALTTCTTLWAARWLDSQVATTRLERSDLVGCLGVLLAISFVLPFGRFWSHTTSEEWYWQALDGLHFVVSMTLYDTMTSVLTISLASAVADDHNMTDQARVANMSSSQLYNLVASLIVATLGLKVFDDRDGSMVNFQLYVVALALLSILVFGTAQSIISGQYLEYTARNRKHKLWHIWKGWTIAVPREIIQWISRGTSSSCHPAANTINGSPTQTNNSQQPQQPNRKIVWRQVLRDLASHSNFTRWLFLEMLLEMQIHFVQTFFKTFVDQLLVDVPHIISDWSLTLLRPMYQLMTIACWVPIRYYGYPRVYTLGLITLWLLASLTLLVASPTTGTTWVLFFLVVYAVGSEALRAAGFYLVMSDLVLELKQSHAQQGRWNEPSLAGLLLGAATLVCKPMQSLLPIVAATLLDVYPDRPRQVLYYLLVIPPWICSLLSLWVWRKYSLNPQRTQELKVELQEIHFFQQQQQQQQTTTPTNGTTPHNKSEHNQMVPSHNSPDDFMSTPKR